MADQMFQYARGRYVNPHKILTANIYSKDSPNGESPSNDGKVLRIAIDLDAVETSKSVVYSDPMPGWAEAEAFILNIPVGSSKR